MFDDILYVLNELERLQLKSFELKLKKLKEVNKFDEEKALKIPIINMMVCRNRKGEMINSDGEVVDIDNIIKGILNTKLLLAALREYSTGL